MAFEIAAGERNLWRDNLSNRLTGAARLKIYNDANILVYNASLASKTVYDRRIEIVQSLGAGDCNGHLLAYVTLHEDDGDWLGTVWLTPPVDRRAGAAEYGTIVNIILWINF